MNAVVYLGMIYVSWLTIRFLENCPMEFSLQPYLTDLHFLVFQKCFCDFNFVDLLIILTICNKIKYFSVTKVSLI